DSTQVDVEIPVDGFDPVAWQQLEQQLRQIREREGIREIDLPAGVSDYVLYRENGETLADQMKNRRKEEGGIDLLDLSDVIATSGYIILRERPEPVFYEDYRQMVTQKVLDLIDSHPTIAAIDRGELVTDLQLIELERTLREELGGGEMELTEENIRKAYRMRVTSMLEFLRNLLELEGIPNYEEIVKRQFSEFLARHSFNGDQVRFLIGVQGVFLQKRRLQLADLYDPPLDRVWAGCRGKVVFPRRDRRSVTIHRDPDNLRPLGFLRR
ncbi:MAG: type I restriction-modification enzyme R subunit C-terminal domain-containing protein, partial [Acidobacteriota bacterium]